MMRGHITILAAMMLMSTAAQAAELRGVPTILDGNTFAIGATLIRLEHIDAPETDQVCLNAKGELWACGIEARDQLAAHIAGQEISCTLNGVEASPRRTLATCSLAGEDLSGWMIEQGWALPNFRRSFTYVRAEENARSQKRGLWQGAFVAPWEWRRRTNKTTILGAVSAPQAMLLGLSASARAPSSECTIKGDINRFRKRIYHTQNQKTYAKIRMDKLGRRWFCTTEEAEAAGWRRAWR